MKRRSATLLRVASPAALISAFVLLGMHIARPSESALRYRPQVSPWMRAHPDVMQSLVGEPDALKNVQHREASRSSFSYDAFAQQQRAFPAANVPASAYPAGFHEAQQVERLKAPLNWQELGPTYTPDAGFNNPHTGASSPVSGRMSALAVVPATCSTGGCGTMYLGAAYGGVWKTTDGGQSWKPILDRAASTAIGAITLDPKDPNIIYVGTGESAHSGDSHRGVGVLRSTDGGQSWTNLGYNEFVNRAIAALIVDPRTAGGTNATLYAVSTRATSGGGTTGGGNPRDNPYLPAVGFYVSKDGGATWTSSNPDGAIEGSQSLVMDPINPDVLYAGFEPDTRLHTDPTDTAFYASQGIYKSTNDGRTWTHLTTNLPSLYVDAVSLGIAPSNPNILYAAMSVSTDSLFKSAGFSGSAHEEFFKSTDAGASWTKMVNTPDACNDQCDYTSPIAVDPHDPNVVYTGGSANYDYSFGQNPECATLNPLPAVCKATIIKTTDGGNSWADIGENNNAAPVHPDDHVIVINPKDSNSVYTGTDGGLFHSTDGGQNWKDLNKGLGTLQFTGLSVSTNGAIYAGTQDNGTFKYTGSTTWQHIAGGDGGPTATAANNPNRVYHSYFGPTLFRNDSGGSDPSKDVFIAPFYGDELLRGLGQFYAPYTLAPTRPNTIFYGTYRVWRSNIAGGVDGNHDGDATNDRSDKNDWVPISFDLRCAGQPHNPSTVCGVGNSGGTTQGRGIGSLAVSPTNANVVVVGATNGLVWITKNALAPVKTDSSCSPSSNIRGVALCDYVSGPSWRQIDRQLPQRYPTSIKFAPGSGKTLYITLSGFNKNTLHHPGHVFVSTDLGQHWKNINGTGKSSSLPDLPFNDIVVNPGNGHLYTAADYGGVFVSKNHGRTWSRIDQGLPSAPVYQMQYYAPKHVLIVATHGRGVWQVVAP
ncbi:MAG: exo-alpha-sialidase [Chloroflexota bacterium]